MILVLRKGAAKCNGGKVLITAINSKHGLSLLGAENTMIFF
ncbi:hypothetical protein [Methyloglobulus sp.]